MISFRTIIRNLQLFPPQIHSRCDRPSYITTDSKLKDKSKWCISNLLHSSELCSRKTLNDDARIICYSCPSSKRGRQTWRASAQAEKPSEKENLNNWQTFREDKKKEEEEGIERENNEKKINIYKAFPMKTDDRTRYDVPWEVATVSTHIT